MPMPRTDTERLDWLEGHAEGCALISDDAGSWAVAGDGFQDIGVDMPMDLNTSFFIPKGEWKPSVREAIDAAIDAHESYKLRGSK